jgi:hypothetical protein
VVSFVCSALVLGRIEHFVVFEDARQGREGRRGWGATSWHNRINAYPTQLTLILAIGAAESRFLKDGVAVEHQMS